MNKPVQVVSLLHLSERPLAQLRLVSPRLVVQQYALPSEEQWLRAPNQQFAEALSPETEILYTHAAPFEVRRDLNGEPLLNLVQSELGY